MRPVKSDPTFDRRKYLRVGTEQVISIGHLDEREGLAHALDLSMGGLRFQCVGQQVGEGEMLKVTLTLNKATTSVVGQVRRVSELDAFTQEVALCFVKMDEEIRQRLESNLPAPEDASGQDERRGFSRIPVGEVVAVARANLADMVAQARDVSLGGIRFLIQDMELQLGDVLRLVLDLGEGEIRAVGQIVRVTEVEDFQQEIAVAFLDVDPASLERMRDQLSPDSDTF